MISYLKGEIIELGQKQITILTSAGVGYNVFVNEITSAGFTQKQKIELYIFHNISENAQSLFGMVTQNEKAMFSELIKISGIGGKVALSILGLGVNNLKNAIKTEDNKTLESISGVGKKMAEKIILELKDKDLIKEFVINGDNKDEVENNLNNRNIDSNIYQTLTNMGYYGKDVEGILKNIPDEISDIGEILRYAIKELS